MRSLPLFSLIVFSLSCTRDEKNSLCPVEPDKITNIIYTDRNIEIISSDSLVRAIFEGEVEEVSMSNYTEKQIMRQVTVKNDSVTYLSYYDLTRVLVRVGQKVNKGDVLGVSVKRDNQFTTSLGVWKSKRPYQDTERVNPKPYCTCEKIN